MKEKNNIISRPPVVVVMGHIDHGKSTLLDYIRKTNIVDTEAGGITQHISAYVVNHKDEKGVEKTITFLDTPGHEAFSHMRERGAVAADIAILVVSAEDSVKAQTIEAWNTITESKVPYVVAINKIDKPNANPEKVKLDLAEKGIYLEGYGGDVPFALVSSKTGAGINDLLDIILLVADMNELSGDASLEASGVVIESNLDQKRGISATLIVKNGTLKSGEFVVVDDSMAPVRIFEDFRGKPIKEAPISSPVRITGFTKLPNSGQTFVSFKTKKEAEEAIENNKLNNKKQAGSQEALCSTEDLKVIPIIIKADVAGVGEAVLKEIKKIENDCVKFKILANDVGLINENDIKLAQSDKETVILGRTAHLIMVARHNTIGDVRRIQQIHGGIGIRPLGWDAGIVDDVAFMGNIHNVFGSLVIYDPLGLCCESRRVGRRIILSIGQHDNGEVLTGTSACRTSIEGDIHRLRLWIGNCHR